MEILLDTNIISYLGQTASSIPALQYLKGLSRSGNSFAISEITVYEFLCSSNEEERKDMTQLADQIKNYSVSREVLVYASKLFHLFRTKDQNRRFDSPDMIIASTSIINKTFLLTANQRDYPEPYFIELDVFPLIFISTNKRSQCILVSLLAPDYGKIPLNL